jgi:hypothetical protein
MPKLNFTGSVKTIFKQNSFFFQWMKAFSAKPVLIENTSSLVEYAKKTVPVCGLLILQTIV